jgi:hypothetical protein
MESERLRETPVKPITIRVGRPLPQWQFRAWQLLAPRVPRWVRVLLGRIVLQLPLGSRARRWCVLLVARVITDPTARGWPDLVVPVWDAEGEWRWGGDFAALGFDELYRGNQGVKRSIENWNTLWSGRKGHSPCTRSWMVAIRSSCAGPSSGLVAVLSGCWGPSRMVMTPTPNLVMRGSERRNELRLLVAGGCGVPFGGVLGAREAAPFGADQIGQRGE